VRGWLGDEEFRGILRFARYLGRDDGAALFEFDPERMERSGLDPRDVVAILSSIPGVDPGDLEGLRAAILSRLEVRVSYEPGGWILVSSKGVRLRDHFEGLGWRPVYDRGRRAFRARAHLYRELVEHLKSRGLLVRDDVGLLDGARLPRPLEFQGCLRPYQEEALEAWLSNGGRGVVALPTGAGKTVIAIAAMARLGVATLVVVYTKEHIGQWMEAIRRFTNAGGMVGAYYSEEKSLRPITVTTYQTAFRRLDDFATRFALVVFDEAHHLPADKFRAIAMGLPAPYRLGLSATVEREDGKHVEIFPVVGGVVYSTTPGQLTRQGYLAPFQIRRVPVDLPPSLKREYQRLRRQYQALARGRRFEEVLEAMRRGDPQAVEALRIHARMRSLVQENPAKLEAVERIVREELARGSKIIVFTQYRRQAEELARRLGALLIHGELDAQKRRRALQAFREAPSGVLVVTTVGDEGLDIPDANVGILVSGTGSRRQFLQRLGRLLRPAPGKQAVLYEIVTAGSPEEYQSKRRRGLIC
jgi:superfamily II DNA or RNA helicase